jgi:hypothetical protein
MRWFPSQLPHMISRWSSLFKSDNAIPRPFSLLTRISVSPATSTNVPLVRPFLIPHLHDWRKMEVCLINLNKGEDDEGFLWWLWKESLNSGDHQFHLYQQNPQKKKLLCLFSQRRISFVLGYLRMILWKISTAISIKHRILATLNTPRIQLPVSAQWSQRLYVKVQGKIMHKDMHKIVFQSN